MRHRLVQQIESALGWTGPQGLGSEFSIGHMPDDALCERVLNPHKLLSLILRRSLNSPQLRCLQDGRDLRPSAYLTTTTTGRGQGVTVADMHKLGRVLAQGATMVLDDVGPMDATMEIACRALGWWANELTRVNIYLSTQEASGWGIHWDSHDVLCVQLAGEKSWEVRGSSRPAPMERDAAPNLEPSTDVVWSGTMQPGDVMHIPRGWWHQATRSDRGCGFSLHATFGITQRTGTDWLRWVSDQARAEEVFRRDLGQPDGHQLAEAAIQLIKASPPGEYITARKKERAPARQVATHGIFGAPQAVVCVTDFPPQLRLDDTKVVVTAAGKRISFPAVACPALEPMLSGRPANIDQITATTGVDAAAIAEVLLGERMCAELTPDLSYGYEGMIYE